MGNRTSLKTKGSRRATWLTIAALWIQNLALAAPPLHSSKNREKVEEPLSPSKWAFEMVPGSFHPPLKDPHRPIDHDLTPGIKIEGRVELFTDSPKQLLETSDLTDLLNNLSPSQQLGLELILGRTDVTDDTEASELGFAAKRVADSIANPNLLDSNFTDQSLVKGLTQAADLLTGLPLSLVSELAESQINQSTSDRFHALRHYLNYQKYEDRVNVLSGPIAADHLRERLALNPHLQVAVREFLRQHPEARRLRSHLDGVPAHGSKDVRDKLLHLEKQEAIRREIETHNRFLKNLKAELLAKPSPEIIKRLLDALPANLQGVYKELIASAMANDTKKVEELLEQIAKSKDSRTSENLKLVSQVAGSAARLVEAFGGSETAHDVAFALSTLSQIANVLYNIVQLGQATSTGDVITAGANLLILVLNFTKPRQKPIEQVILEEQRQIRALLLFIRNDLANNHRDLKRLLFDLEKHLDRRIGLLESRLADFQRETQERLRNFEVLANEQRSQLNNVTNTIVQGHAESQAKEWQSQEQDIEALVTEARGFERGKTTKEQVSLAATSAVKAINKFGKDAIHNPRSTAQIGADLSQNKSNFKTASPGTRLANESHGVRHPDDELAKIAEIASHYGIDLSLNWSHDPSPAQTSNRPVSLSGWHKQAKKYADALRLSLDSHSEVPATARQELYRKLCDSDSISKDLPKVIGLAQAYENVLKEIAPPTSEGQPSMEKILRVLAEQDRLLGDFHKITPDSKLPSRATLDGDLETKVRRRDLLAKFLTIPQPTEKDVRELERKLQALESLPRTLYLNQRLSPCEPNLEDGTATIDLPMITEVEVSPLIALIAKVNGSHDSPMGSPLRGCYSGAGRSLMKSEYAGDSLNLMLHDYGTLSLNAQFTLSLGQISWNLGKRSHSFANPDHSSGLFDFGTVRLDPYHGPKKEGLITSSSARLDPNAKERIKAWENISNSKPDFIGFVESPTFQWRSKAYTAPLNHVLKSWDNLTLERPNLFPGRFEPKLVQSVNMATILHERLNQEIAGATHNFYEELKTQTGDIGKALREFSGNAQLARLIFNLAFGDTLFQDSRLYALYSQLPTPDDLVHQISKNPDFFTNSKIRENALNELSAKLKEAVTGLSAEKWAANIKYQRAGITRLVDELEGMKDRFAADKDCYAGQRFIPAPSADVGFSPSKAKWWGTNQALWVRKLSPTQATTINRLTSVLGSSANSWSARMLSLKLRSANQDDLANSVETADKWIHLFNELARKSEGFFFSNSSGPISNNIRLSQIAKVTDAVGDWIKKKRRTPNEIDRMESEIYRLFEKLSDRSQKSNYSFLLADPNDETNFESKVGLTKFGFSTDNIVEILTTFITKLDRLPSDSELEKILSVVQAQLTLDGGLIVTTDLPKSKLKSQLNQVRATVISNTIETLGSIEPGQISAHLDKLVTETDKKKSEAIAAHQELISTLIEARRIEKTINNEFSLARSTMESFTNDVQISANRREMLADEQPMFEQEFDRLSNVVSELNRNEHAIKTEINDLNDLIKTWDIKSVEYRTKRQELVNGFKARYKDFWSKWNDGSVSIAGQANSSKIRLWRIIEHRRP